METLKVKFGYKPNGEWALGLESEVKTEHEMHFDLKVKEEVEYLLDYITQCVFSRCDGDYGDYKEGDVIKYEIDMNLWTLWEEDVNMNLMMGGLRNHPNWDLENGFNLTILAGLSEDEDDEWVIESVKNDKGELEKFIVSMTYRDM